MSGKSIFVLLFLKVRHIFVFSKFLVEPSVSMYILIISGSAIAANPLFAALPLLAHRFCQIPFMRPRDGKTWKN